MANFLLLITAIKILQSREKRGTYKKHETNSKGYWCLEVTLGPFLKGLCEFVKKDSDVEVFFNRITDLPDVSSKVHMVS